MQLSEQEARIIDLLLEGCENEEIAKRIGKARRTVKAHFNRMFMKCGISGGVKRVKLAAMFYRFQLQGVNYRSLRWYPKGLATARLQLEPERLRTLSRTGCAPSSTS